MMSSLLFFFALTTVFAPLFGACFAGIPGRYFSKKITHAVTIFCMLISVLSAAWLCCTVIQQGLHITLPLYVWANLGFLENGGFAFTILLDPTSAVISFMICLVSLLVHIYSIGYLSHDPSNPRFFAYVSLFTFFMLLLVFADNFLQLLLGWEGVGLVSYLLIGFWFQKKSATEGALKAFLINRIGDLGFIAGICILFSLFNSLQYAQIFQKLSLSDLHKVYFITPHWAVSSLSLASLLLFIGAMAKSAQVPLHIWLPESMEGPTPISALIHAATMVTAGVFMLIRLSPLFMLTPDILTGILWIGTIGAVMTGLLALVEKDIKRVIAYSTMSQLGYMMAANGAMGFSASFFHLLMHAFFKALLFLVVGMIIYTLQHEQNLFTIARAKLRNGLLYVTFLIGALSLSALPPFSGFYSKEAILTAVSHTSLLGAHAAYILLLIGAFLTPLYIFRVFFMVFHTPQSTFAHTALVEIPQQALGFSMKFSVSFLSLLTLISGGIGWFFYHNPTATLGDMLSQNAWYALLTDIHYLSFPVYIALSGILVAWLWVCVINTKIKTLFLRMMHWPYKILVLQYGIELFIAKLFLPGIQTMANFFFKTLDLQFLDASIVEGMSKTMLRFAKGFRSIQTGNLQHYLIMFTLILLFFLYKFLG